MGSLPAGITRRGRLTLTEDGRIEARKDNGEKIGEIVVGIDGLYFDGFEPIFTQRNDPPKLRLAARYDSGIGGGGAISFNRLRADDRMEEQVMINCGSLDNPTDDRGMFRVLIRQSQNPEDWGVAFVATTGYLGRLWTGAGNFMGWLWKYANPGDVPPGALPGAPPAPPAQPAPAPPPVGFIYRGFVQGDFVALRAAGPVEDTDEPQYLINPTEQRWREFVDKMYRRR